MILGFSQAPAPSGLSHPAGWEAGSQREQSSPDQKRVSAQWCSVVTEARRHRGKSVSLTPLAPHLAAGRGSSEPTDNGETSHFVPCVPLHLLWVSLRAPPLDPLPAHRCVSLISFILSLIHPFPGRVSTSLSLSHTHTHSQCTGLGLHPTHTPCEILWHTFPWVSMILSFSIPSCPSPSVGKNKVFVLTAVVRFLGC